MLPHGADVGLVFRLRVERLEAVPPPYPTGLVVPPPYMQGVAYMQGLEGVEGVEGVEGAGFVQPQAVPGTAVADSVVADSLGSDDRGGYVEEEAEEEAEGAEEGGELPRDCDKAGDDCDEAEAAPLRGAAPVEPIEPTALVEPIELIEPMLVAAPVVPVQSEQRVQGEQRVQSGEVEVEIEIEVASAPGEVASVPRRTRHSIGGGGGAPAEPPQRVQSGEQREQSGEVRAGEVAGEVGLLHVGPPPPPRSQDQVADRAAGVGHGQVAEEWVACDDCAKWRRAATP